MNRTLRVAIVADLVQEGWASMDLVADRLVTNLTTPPERRLSVDLLRPTLPSRGNGIGRFVNRFWDYSRWLRQHTSSFDVFHVVDHSYAHLVHVLPPDRTVVTCHDIDAFLSIARPDLNTSKLPSAVVRLVLAGMRKAARVTCASAATYDDVRRYDLVPADRLLVVPNGTHEQFFDAPDPAFDVRVDELLAGCPDDAIFLVHVGSCLSRKRIDILLKVVAAVRAIEPRAVLVKAGGTLTAEQRDLARGLGLDGHVFEMPFLDTATLAALYRHADVALLTSEREGFGLPVIEAMACGTPVVATDLPVLREVGGDAATYCALEDIDGWRHAIMAVLAEQRDPVARESRKAQRQARARRFTWSGYADTMTRVYREIATS